MKTLVTQSFKFDYSMNKDEFNCLYDLVFNQEFATDEGHERLKTLIKTHKLAMDKAINLHVLPIGKVHDDYKCIRLGEQSDKK